MNLIIELSSRIRIIIYKNLVSLESGNILN